MSINVPDQSLVKLISEAAFDSSKWAEVCEGLTNVIGSCGSLILPTESDRTTLGIPHSASLEASVNRYVNDQWFRRDVRYKGFNTMLKRGYITDEDCIEYDKVADSDFYQDFLRPEKLKWFTGVSIKTENDLWILSVNQAWGKGQFSNRDIQKLMSYRDQLNTSASISRLLGFAQVQSASHILEQHGRAVIALGWDGRVTHVSKLAESHIGTAFQIVRGYLRAQSERDRLTLGQLVNSLCNNQIHNASLPPIPISRDPDRPALVVYGCALPERERDIFRSAVALLVISDPERSQNVPAEFLMDYYGITRAEARLAISLCKGLSIEKHALENAVSPVTTRNQLQSLLRKTETHNKAELVATLYKILPL